MMFARLLLFTLTLATTVSASPPQPVECFLVVADGAAATNRDALLAGFTLLVGNTLPEGSIVHLVAAPNHEPIATVIIGDGSRSSRLRDRSIRPQLLAIVQWVRSDERSQASSMPQMTELPGVVRSMRRSELPLWIIVIADPIYHSPAHAAWSMRQGHVPSDASATQAPSPFAIGGQFPEGTRVDWGLLAPNWGAHAGHRDAVERFWRVWCQTRGAQLGRFTLDLPAIFGRGEFTLPSPIELVEGPPGMLETDYRVVEGGVIRGGYVYQPAPQDNPVVSPTQETKELSDGAPAEDERPASDRSQRDLPPQEAPSEPPTPAPAPVPASVSPVASNSPAERPARSRPVEISIAWRSDDPRCDLDLRVLDPQTGEELTHKSARKSFGLHRGDITRAGSCDVCDPRPADWERVVVRRDRLDDLAVWINAYRTSAPAEVVAKITYNGRSREKTFTIDIDQGDLGKDAQQRHQSDYWVLLPMPRSRVAVSVPLLPGERSILVKSTTEGASHVATR